GSRMGHIRNADAVSVDDRLGQMDRVSPFRQCEASRPQLLRGSDPRPRARRPSKRHRSVSVFCGRGVAGGISPRAAAPDRRTGGAVLDRADRLRLHLSRQPPDAALDPVESRICNQYRDLLPAGGARVFAGLRRVLLSYPGPSTWLVPLQTQLSSSATRAAEWPPADRLRRVIQYAAASRFIHERLWDTGSSAFADDDSGYSFSFSRRVVPEVCSKLFALSKTEGAGNAGCALHPRSHVQWVERVRT